MICITLGLASFRIKQLMEAKLMKYLKELYLKQSRYYGKI